ncbi:MAG: hypothetical protein U0984_06830 [Prosthecobacter sp.]|nr:hypothetical protein [Prosthecobacter sp.]
MPIDEAWTSIQVEAAQKELGARYAGMSPMVVHVLITMATLELGKSAGASCLVQRAELILQLSKTISGTGK